MIQVKNTVSGNVVVERDTLHGGSKSAAFVYKYDSFSNTWIELNTIFSDDDCKCFFGGAMVLAEDDGLKNSCPN